VAQRGSGREVLTGLQKLYECVRRAMKQTLDADGSRWQAALRQNIRGPKVLTGPKSATADLATRSGFLGRSFGWVLSGTDQLDGMTAQKYTTSRYALIHEMGGVIRPRTARMLAIPLRPAMTASGLSREPGPRSYGRQLFVLRIKGKVFLARARPRTRRQLRSTALASVAHAHGAKVKSPAEQTLELMYVLKDHVYIPPRLKMRAIHAGDQEQRLVDLERFAALQMQAAFPATGDAPGAPAP
jgi:hypothetical protein